MNSLVGNVDSRLSGKKVKTLKKRDNHSTKSNSWEIYIIRVGIWNGYKKIKMTSSTAPWRQNRYCQSAPTNSEMIRASFWCGSVIDMHMATGVIHCYLSLFYE